MRCLVTDSLLASPPLDAQADLIPLSSVNAHRRGWPDARQLASIADGVSWLAITLCEDGSTVAEMLAAAETMLSREVPSTMDHRGLIVHAAESLPTGLSEVFPQEISGLLRRIQTDDLLVLSTAQFRKGHAGSPLPELVKQSSPLTTCLNRRPLPQRFPEIGPGRSEVTSSTLQNAARHVTRRLAMTGEREACLLAGLLLLWDHLEESHQISQTMEGHGNPRTADYWHGIMHRREPDAGNAAWWFRKVGRHPVLSQLGKDMVPWMRQLGATPAMVSLATGLLRSDQWLDPFRLIDLSTVALRCPGSDEEHTARMVQYLEMLLLLRFCLQTS